MTTIALAPNQPTPATDGAAELRVLRAVAAQMHPRYGVGVEGLCWITLVTACTGAWYGLYLATSAIHTW